MEMTVLFRYRADYSQIILLSEDRVASIRHTIHKTVEYKPAKARPWYGFHPERQSWTTD